MCSFPISFSCLLKTKYAKSLNKILLLKSCVHTTVSIFWIQHDILEAQPIGKLRNFPTLFYSLNCTGDSESPHEFRFPQYEAAVLALTYKVQTVLRIQFEGQPGNKSRTVECLRELLRSGRYILLVEGTGSSSLYE